ncbi:heavy-metal-associated domain-containing protein [Aquicoccus sp. SU-CL01552]|uniref:heavy-metal-associated domain-containing protein n=1 Tax=Aquicoccus sp. SU-CL01552 TaxID=3127656 RepID=UPI003102B6F2
MKFSVPDMSCGHCTAAIEAAIKAKDPGATVECDLANRHVAVTGTLSGAAIESTLAEVGYPATPAVA